MVDEEALFSSNRSFEDWQEEMGSNTDSIEENDFKLSDAEDAKTSAYLNSEIIPTTKCQSIIEKQKSTTVEKNLQLFEDDQHLKKQDNHLL